MVTTLSSIHGLGNMMRAYKLQMVLRRETDGFRLIMAKDWIASTQDIILITFSMNNEPPNSENLRWLAIRELRSSIEEMPQHRNILIATFEKITLRAEDERLKIALENFKREQ